MEKMMSGWIFVREDPELYHVAPESPLGFELYSEVKKYRADDSFVIFRNSMGYFSTGEEAEKRKRQSIALDALFADSGDLL